MTELKFEELLEAGCHFGHLKRKWNPKMAPYIFKEHNGIHVIDLQKTIAKAEEAATALKQIAKSGKKVLFVATKKQAKDVVADMVKAVDMPFVTERWPGGMLTNFTTIRKAVKKMNSLDQMMHDKDFNNISKRERLQVQRERAKLDKNLGSIADLTRLPSALFVIDINKEHIAVAEARRLNIPLSQSSIPTATPTSSTSRVLPTMMHRSRLPLSSNIWLRPFRKVSTSVCSTKRTTLRKSPRRRTLRTTRRPRARAAKRLVRVALEERPPLLTINN